MRKGAVVAGWLLLVSGVLVLTAHAFLYFDGLYRRQAEGAVRISRQLEHNATGVPDSRDETTQVFERVRSYLLIGFFAAGKPIVLGAGLLVRSRRGRGDVVAAGAAVLLLIATVASLLYHNSVAESAAHLRRQAEVWPQATPNKAEEAETRAVAVVERLGGKVKRESGWVVEVDLLDCEKCTDADLKHLGGLVHLRRLNLSGSRVTDAGLSALKPLASLETLILGSLEVTGATLKELSGLKKLTHINFSFSKVTDEGLKDVASLAGLKELTLEEAPITDATLEEIAKLKGLEVLDLNGAKKVTDAGLRKLVALDHLHTLRISDTGVTDAGLQDLAKLERLDAIFLVFCKVTDDGVKKFKAAKPKCSVFK